MQTPLLTLADVLRYRAILAAMPVVQAVKAKKR